MLLIFKKVPEAYRESHRLGNCRSVISSLGPISVFFLTVLDKLFLFSALFSLPYLYVVLSIYTVSFPAPGIISGMVPQNNFWIRSDYNK